MEVERTYDCISHRFLAFLAKIKCDCVSQMEHSEVLIPRSRGSENKRIVYKMSFMLFSLFVSFHSQK